MIEGLVYYAVSLLIGLVVVLLALVILPLVAVCIIIAAAFMYIADIIKCAYYGRRIKRAILF